jgi:hypothetical protein
MNVLEYWDSSVILLGRHEFFYTGYLGVLSPSDAFLAFLIIEMGVFCFIVSLVPFIVFACVFSHRTLWILLFILFMQTIVDTGIFYIEAYMFLPIFYILSREKV